MSVTIVIAAGLTVAAGATAARHPTSSDHPSASPTALVTPTTTSTPVAATAPSRPSKPLVPLARAVRSYIAHRDGRISVAVRDEVAGKRWLIHPTRRGRAASVTKIDLLETLLHRTGGHLSGSQRALATEMIERSDNKAATSMWLQDAGAVGIGAYNRAVGLSHTLLTIDWGVTRSSAADELLLVRELLHHSRLITNRSRAYMRHLMLHVEGDQRWGITAGVPKDVTVGLKNGWVPVVDDHGRWAVNSVGWVHGRGRRYEVAIMTDRDPYELYGRATVRHIARLVWPRMKTK
jgi:beta-lactamase class A